MPITMSNHLFTLQRRAAEVALRLTDRLYERMPLDKIKDVPTETLVREAEIVARLVCAHFGIEDETHEVAVYALDHLELDGVIASGAAADAYHYAGSNLGWRLEGYDDW